VPTTLQRPIAAVECGAMISTEKATTIEQRLAQLLSCRPDELRDWLAQRVENPPGKTGLRFVRGTHGGAYKVDPDGTDELPPGQEPPPDWKPPTGYRRRRS